ncbi:MAG: glycosyltransferase involved in cell wall biosynthesis [Candidatus Azotimanducaceae bacterium]
MSYQNTNLNVMHIASGDLWAGAEVQLFTLVKYQKYFENIKLLVVLMNDGLLADRLRDIGVEIVVLDERKLNALKVLSNLMTVMKKWKPDIVHTHRQKENILGSIANVLTVRAKSLRTVHGAPEFPENFMKHPLKWAIPQLDYLCARFFQKTVISVSDELADSLKVIYNDAKVAVVLNGVDIIDLQENTMPLIGEFDENLKHIGIVGRLESVKRVDLFLRMAKCAVVDDKMNWRFHVFGDGSLLEGLRAEAEHLGVSSTVMFEGHRGDIAQCIKSMDVLVMCSDHEGLPMTALESVALGTPMVAHSVGGLTKLLSDGAGLLIQNQNVDNYYHAVTDLLEGSKKLPTVLPEQYRAETNAKNIIELYCL